MKKTITIIALLVSIFNIRVDAEVKLPAIFSDNLILQQQSKVSIWGWATPNSSVSISPSWTQKATITTADAQGKWISKITTPKGSETTYTITISDGKPVVLKNVIIGEVWICSGQSNMVWQVKGYDKEPPVEGASEELSQPVNKNIRLFTVPRNSESVPQEDCIGAWEEASPSAVGEFSATAYFFGKKLYKELNIPIGLINCSYGGSSIETWMTPESLAGYDVKIPAAGEIIESNKRHNTPTGLFNGMLHPVIGYGIRGAIWYQGESNAGQPEKYPGLSQKMVAEWRQLWGIGVFPFYYIQIAPFSYDKSINSAFLREAQVKVLDLIPNSGMIVNMDADSPNNIHPPKKKTPAERLANLALSKTYHKKGINTKSLAFKSMKVKGSEVELRFECAKNTSLTSNGKELKEFRIAGADKKFYPANARISGNSILVSASEVSSPVAVRYAFENTSPAEVFATDGLPLSSFRTDIW